MEDVHHTHKEVPAGWLAVVLDAVLWARRPSLEDCEPTGRTAPTPLAEGLHRLSSPH